MRKVGLVIVIDRLGTTGLAVGIFFDEHLFDEGEVGGEGDDGECEAGTEKEVVETGESAGGVCGVG